jgi:hypothetical protein
LPTIRHRLVRGTWGGELGLVRRVSLAEHGNPYGRDGPGPQWWPLRGNLHPAGIERAAFALRLLSGEEYDLPTPADGVGDKDNGAVHGRLSLPVGTDRKRQPLRGAWGGFRLLEEVREKRPQNESGTMLDPPNQRQWDRRSGRWSPTQWLAAIRWWPGLSGSRMCSGMRSRPPWCRLRW